LQKINFSEERLLLDLRSLALSLSTQVLYTNNYTNTKAKRKEKGKKEGEAGSSIDPRPPQNTHAIIRKPHTHEKMYPQKKFEKSFEQRNNHKISEIGGMPTTIRPRGREGIIMPF
jgi:hypothetical protein